MTLERLEYVQGQMSWWNFKAIVLGDDPRRVQSLPRSTQTTSKYRIYCDDNTKYGAFTIAVRLLIPVLVLVLVLVYSDFICWMEEFVDYEVR